MPYQLPWNDSRTLVSIGLYWKQLHATEKAQDKKTWTEALSDQTDDNDEIEELEHDKEDRDES